MRCRRKHAFDGRKFFRNESRHFLQARAVDDDHQIVAAGHEPARFHFIEARDAFGQAIEAAAALGREAHFDDGAHDAGIFLREIQHWTNAQQHAAFFQRVEFAIDIGLGHLEHLRDLRRVQAATFEQQFKHRIHNAEVLQKML